jgi:hypothetical protein
MTSIQSEHNNAELSDEDSYENLREAHRQNRIDAISPMLDKQRQSGSTKEERDLYRATEQEFLSKEASDLFTIYKNENKQDENFTGIQLSPDELNASYNEFYSNERRARYWGQLLIDTQHNFTYVDTSDAALQWRISQKIYAIRYFYHLLLCEGDSGTNINNEFFAQLVGDDYVNNAYIDAVMNTKDLWNDRSNIRCDVLHTQLLWSSNIDNACNYRESITRESAEHIDAALENAVKKMNE